MTQRGNVMHRVITAIVSATLLGACASSPRPMPNNVAVEDFIAAADLEDVGKLRQRSADRWTALNEKYIIYTTRRDAYLIEFQRDCPALVEGLTCRELRGEIRNPSDMLGCMDVRTGTSQLRTGIDTIRSCVISEIYPVTPDQVIELRNLGASEIPGPPS